MIRQVTNEIWHLSRVEGQLESQIEGHKKNSIDFALKVYSMIVLRIITRVVRAGKLNFERS